MGKGIGGLGAAEVAELRILGEMLDGAGPSADRHVAALGRQCVVDRDDRHGAALRRLAIAFYAIAVLDLGAPLIVAVLATPVLVAVLLVPDRRSAATRATSASKLRVRHSSRR